MGPQGEVRPGSEQETITINDPAGEGKWAFTRRCRERSDNLKAGQRNHLGRAARRVRQRRPGSGENTRDITDGTAVERGELPGDW